MGCEVVLRTDASCEDTAWALISLRGVPNNVVRLFEVERQVR